MTHTTLQDIALVAIRLIVAAIFLYHGTAKWAFWSGAPEGMPAGMVTLMKFLSIVEPLGGVALILGFLTKWAAAGLALIMLGALYMKPNVMGVGFVGQQGAGWEFDLAIFGCAIALIAFGGGCWSIDALWKKPAAMGT